MALREPDPLFSPRQMRLPTLFHLPRVFLCIIEMGELGITTDCLHSPHFA